MSDSPVEEYALLLQRNEGVTILTHTSFVMRDFGVRTKKLSVSNASYYFS